MTKPTGAPKVDESTMTPEEWTRNKLTQICTTLEDVKSNMQKTTWALIAIIGAMVGLKFTGSPWYIDVAVGLALFAGIFTLCSVYFWFQRFLWPQRALRISFGCLLLFSSTAHIWVYQAGVEIAPKWFAETTYILLFITAVCVAWAGWVIKPDNKAGG